MFQALSDWFRTAVSTFATLNSLLARLSRGAPESETIDLRAKTKIRRTHLAYLAPQVSQVRPPTDSTCLRPQQYIYIYSMQCEKALSYECAHLYLTKLKHTRRFFCGKQVHLRALYMSSKLGQAKPSQSMMITTIRCQQSLSTQRGCWQR